MNFDIFFISFNESNQEKNWQRVLDLHPTSMRLHGIKGIDRVHLACNQLATTEWFWTVDGDNWLLEKLEWTDYEDYVDLLMFHAIDPISEQWTKLGGVKLWRKDSFINTDMSKGDFCLNATKEKRSPLKVLSRTDYNVTPYEAWKTSFRHCVKLMSSIIASRPLAANRSDYLEHWKSTEHKDTGINNACWAFKGYQDAEQFVVNCDNNLDKLFMINDYTQLKQYFNDRYTL
jgi:hypothetical protein